MVHLVQMKAKQIMGQVPVGNGGILCANSTKHTLRKRRCYELERCNTQCSLGCGSGGLSSIHRVIRFLVEIVNYASIRREGYAKRRDQLPS